MTKIEQDEELLRKSEQITKLVSALKAVHARINGIWDNPDLVAYGSLSTITSDIDRIVSHALKTVK